MSEARPFLAWQGLMKAAVRQDAYRELGPRVPEQATRPFEPVQRIPSGTGPLRRDLHKTLLASIERLNERVDDLGKLMNVWVGRSSQNRA